MVTGLIKGNGIAALEWRALGAQNVMTMSTFFFLLKCVEDDVLKMRRFDHGTLGTVSRVDPALGRSIR